ncbi:MAG: transcription termination factor NusA [Candidatus Levybacteria bacterium]|nr:transcription termination factor NusA [Candidatus Levybacteria bacterium]
MPAVQRSEFALALNQVANERGIDPEIVLDTVQNAILAAYRKDHPDIEVEEYSATLDPNSGEAKIFHEKLDVTPPGFGRIAAQTAKQVILQKIREKEKEAVITDYRVRIGTIVNGMVLRFAGPNIIVDVGKAEGIMPPQEQIANEKYHLNQRMAVYLKEIHEGPKGEEVVVSRADNGLLEGLLKREVPEVAQGSVEIKAIEREPGNRAKIAVYSNQAGIDPVGSCVGQKGVRVQAIIAEFNGLEKIDIIQWQENVRDYVVQALSPAKNITVEMDEKEKTAKVKVPQEELSLAIGKDGQNVRLASKLTGYRIEIEGEGSLVKEEPVEDPKEEVEEKKAEVKEEEKVESEEKVEADAKEEVEEKVAEVTSDLEEAKVDPEAPVEVKAEESQNEPLTPENPETDAKEENSPKSS